jgi:trehalose synthase-fused probable maltokinase
MSNIEPSFPLPAVAHKQLFAPGPQRELLERNLLAVYIPRCRWFAGKARDPRRFAVRDVVAIDAAPDAARLVFVDVEFADQSSETYLLPLQLLHGRAAQDLAAAHPHAIVGQSGETILCDAIHDDAFREALFTLIAAQASRTGEHGTMTGQRGPALATVTGIPSSRPLAVEQSNSSIVYGDHVFFKLYRRLEHGVNPDAEILRFLSGRGFAHTPPFAGSIEYRSNNGEVCVLGLATGLVPNRGDAWSFMLGGLKSCFAGFLAGQSGVHLEQDLMLRVGQLGLRTSELHLALAGETTDPDFSLEPLTPADGRALAGGILALRQGASELLRTKLDTLPAQAQALARRFLALEAEITTCAEAIAASIEGAKIRTHGDYHLGQVLETGSDFVIIDFEGEPLRPLAVRREKRSPLRDVAGMMRSFDYAAFSAVDAQREQTEALSSYAAKCSADAQTTFFNTWLGVTNGAVFRAAEPAQEFRLVEVFLLEKALYEVLYEINNRPTWLPIPLRGVLRLLETEE